MVWTKKLFPTVRGTAFFMKYSAFRLVCAVNQLILLTDMTDLRIENGRR